MSLPKDNYIIIRDASEAERLNIQHEYLLSCQGYYLHPDIPVPSPGARIADIATGTAIFLHEIAEAYPHTECHGFDISDKMFPPRAELAKNVTLHLADVKKPFDDQWLGYFDVLHVRLIGPAMRKDEWGPLLTNIVTLLRPGGWIQWLEGDMPQATRYPTRPEAPFGAAKESLMAVTTAASKPRYVPPRFLPEHQFGGALFSNERAEDWTYGYMNLERLMNDPEVGGLEQVSCDSFVIDRQDDGGKLRRDIATMAVSTIWNMMKARKDMGNQLTDLSRDEFTERMMKDVFAGLHYVARVAVSIGRKKA